MFVHGAGEVDLGLLRGEGAGQEATVEKLRFVVIDIGHPQRDPYAHLGLLPIDVKVLFGGLRTEQGPEVRGQRTSTQRELRSKVRGYKVGGGKEVVDPSRTVTCTCTSSSSSSSCSRSKEPLTLITPSGLMSNQPGLVESGKSSRNSCFQ